MSFLLKTRIFFTFFLLFEITIANSLHLPSNNQHEKNLHFNQNKPIIGPMSNLVGCGNLVCQKINEFQIAKNFFFNCHEKYLPVQFNVSKDSNESHNFFGFLPLQGSGNLILHKQEYSHGCQKIKR